MGLYSGGTIWEVDKSYEVYMYKPDGLGWINPYDTTYGLYLAFWGNDVSVPFDGIKEGWHHIATSWNGEDQVIVGIDGHFPDGYIWEEYTQSWTFQEQPFHLPRVPTPDNEATTFIGKMRHNGHHRGSEFFTGTIDDVRVWNVARTEQEIRDNMHRSLQGNEPGLIGYWRFDEGQGQIVQDMTSNQNHGTLGMDAGIGSDDPSWELSTRPTPVPTNLPPTQPVVEIVPPDPKTFHDLVCFATGSVDPEGEPVNLTYAWYRDGELVEDETSFLSHTHTSRGQMIECIVTPDDGEVAGSSASDTVEILNSPPTRPVVRILPENPTPLTGLAVWIEVFSTDPDEDDIHYLFEWYESSDGENWTRRPEVSGSLNPFFPGSPSVSPLYTQVGEHWRVDVTPVESHTVKESSERFGSALDESVAGVPGSDSVLIWANLVDVVGSDPGESRIDSADLLVLLSVWHNTQEEIPPSTRSLFFETGTPSGTRIGLKHLFELTLNGWYRPVARESR
jgi:hypothetical protein